MSELILQQDSVTIDKIREYLDTMGLTQNLTKSEAKQFIEIASAYGLNPFKREIYASKFGNNFSIIVGFETYLKRAERSGKLAGWNVITEGTIDWSNIRQSDMRATITIYRKDWTHPFIHTVYFGEYVQLKSDGTPNKFWKEKGVTMIKKVAMAQGFRLCFSDENGGMPYTSEEIASEQVMEAIVVETNPMQQPAKRKYTKKNSDEYAAVIAKIKTAMDLDTLKGIWNDHPECKNVELLKNLVAERKKFLQDVEANSKAQIDSAKSEDEIWTAISDVTNPAVLKYAKDKIEQLSMNLDDLAESTN